MHTIGPWIESTNQYDEYESTSQYKTDESSLLNQGNELRERHFDFIKSELNRELGSTIKGEFIIKII